MTDKGLLCTGAAGSVIAAICCFTPALVLLLGAVGLAARNPRNRAASGHQATLMTPTRITGPEGKADIQVADRSALTPGDAASFT